MAADYCKLSSCCKAASVWLYNVMLPLDMMWFHATVWYDRVLRQAAQKRMQAKSPKNSKALHNLMLLKA